MTHGKYTPEQEVALRYIEQIMSFWEITPAELRRAPAAQKLPPPPPKYRHPVSGDVWDGVGKQPQWLRDALLKEGLTVDELKAQAPLDR
jgi:DNA-binding protein H-NS